MLGVRRTKVSSSTSVLIGDANNEFEPVKLNNCKQNVSKVQSTRLAAICHLQYRLGVYPCNVEDEACFLAVIVLGNAPAMRYSTDSRGVRSAVLGRERIEDARLVDGRKDVNWGVPGSAPSCS